MAKSGTSYCGAGSERNIVWLKMHRALQIQELRSILVESCFQNVSSELVLAGSKLTVLYDDEDGSYALTYDNGFPQRGFTIAKTP